MVIIFTRSISHVIVRVTWKRLRDQCSCLAVREVFRSFLRSPTVVCDLALGGLHFEMYASGIKLPKLVGKRSGSASGYPKLPVAIGGKYYSVNKRNGCRLPPIISIVEPQLPQIEAKSIPYRGKRIVTQLPVVKDIVAQQGKNSVSSSDCQYKMFRLSSSESSSFDVDDGDCPVPLLKLPANINDYHDSEAKEQCSIVNLDIPLPDPKPLLYHHKYIEGGFAGRANMKQRPTTTKPGARACKSIGSIIDEIKFDFDATDGLSKSTELL